MSDPVRRPGSPVPPLGDDDPLDPPPGLLELFWVFSKIGILSFGGALSSWVHREISVKRRWMTETDVLSSLALAQIMPGINVVNLSLFCGQRLRGVLGSFVSVMGILAAPTVLVILISTVFDKFSHYAWVSDLLNGIAAAAIGMLIHMGVKATQRSARSIPIFLIVVAIFIGVGILKIHMVIVVLLLGPLAVWLSYRAVMAEQRAREEAQRDA
ncbi:MAG TPA: chromate transporter [Alphaproteobacteria bacterium]|nr:chromate transporter [Alphaproteobacteria bacterium]